jgi:hypothetical protein
MLRIRKGVVMISRRIAACTVTVSLLLFSGTMVSSDRKPIRNYSLWLDTEGQPISCHDGGISRFGNKFYWYGTGYAGNPEGLWGRKGAHLQNGFVAYSSENLVDWKKEGVCFEFPKTGWLALGTSHRPNVLFNEKTGKYVLWFFCIGTVEPEYPAAMLAVAVSDDPEGPFRFLGQRPSGEPNGWGQDLGLFKDSDGRGYLVYDDGHRNIRVDLLSEDYLSVSGQTVIALRSDEKNRYEGAAMARFKGKYIVAGSGVQGWNPTETSYAVAESPLGPYREMGLMSENKTWNSQISNFVHVAESDILFAMCDQWFRGPGGDRVPIDQSGQLWVPVLFDPKTGKARMQHLEQWNPFP